MSINVISVGIAIMGLGVAVLVAYGALEGTAVIGLGVAFACAGAASLHNAGVLERMWSWIDGLTREPSASENDDR